MSTSEAMGVVSEETLIRLLTPKVRSFPLPPPHPSLVSRADLPHSSVCACWNEKWAYYLPIPLLKKVDLAFTELDRHMLSLLSSRRSSLEKGEEMKEDLFSSLVLNAASLEGEGGEEGVGGAGVGEGGLSDREILGNTFIFLLYAPSSLRSFFSLSLPFSI